MHRFRMHFMNKPKPEFDLGWSGWPGLGLIGRQKRWQSWMLQQGPKRASYAPPKPAGHYTKTSTYAVHSSWGNGWTLAFHLGTLSKYCGWFCYYNWFEILRNSMKHERHCPPTPWWSQLWSRLHMQISSINRLVSNGLCPTLQIWHPSQWSLH